MKTELAHESVTRPQYTGRTLDSTNRIAIRNVLFATDLSATAAKALPYAVEIAKRYRSKVCAVHVIGPEVYPYAPALEWPKLAEGEEVWRSEEKAELEQQLRDVPHEVIIQQGEVCDILNDLVRTKEIDLLVIGTRGRTGIKKALLGSVAAKVFRQATCPVLTVGPQVDAKPRPEAELNRILYATDFSPESLAAAPFAISLAREHRAQLMLLNCLEDHGELQVMLHTLRDLVPFGAELRCTPTCLVERGPHGEKVLEVSESHGAELIVLGVGSTNRHLTSKIRLERSALYKIVTQATCPVLTVRAETFEK